MIYEELIRQLRIVVTALLAGIVALVFLFVFGVIIRVWNDQMIKQFLEQRRQWMAAKKKERLKKRLRAFIRYFQENENTGLLFNALANLKEVSTVRLVEGRHSYADVTMRDGFTLTGYGYWAREVLRDAATKVVLRLRAVGAIK